MMVTKINCTAGSLAPAAHTCVQQEKMDADTGEIDADIVSPAWPLLIRLQTKFTEAAHFSLEK